MAGRAVVVMSERVYPFVFPSGLVRLAPHPGMEGCCCECGWHHAREGVCTACGAPVVFPAPAVESWRSPHERFRAECRETLGRLSDQAVRYQWSLRKGGIEGEEIAREYQQRGLR